MRTLHYAISIQAPLQVVWDTMLNLETYRQWTAGFCEGSYYEGTWDEGATMLFLSPSGEGMKAMIAENRPLQRLSIRHLACIGREKEDPIAEPAYENYTFREIPGGTELLVDMDCFEQFEAMFQNLWPRSLELLKGLCESRR